jgi:hypothetical protein
MKGITGVPQRTFLASRSREARVAEALALEARALAIALHAVRGLLALGLVTGGAGETILASAGEVFLSLARTMTGAAIGAFTLFARFTLVAKVAHALTVDTEAMV